MLISFNYLQANANNYNQIQFNGKHSKLSDPKAVAGKGYVSSTPEQITKNPASAVEVTFYRDLPNSGLPAQVFPKVYRLGEHSISMENIAKGMLNPTFMDIKLGGTFENLNYLQDVKSHGHTADELAQKQANRIEKNQQNGSDKNHYAINGYSGQPYDNKQQNHPYIAQQGNNAILGQFFHNDAESMRDAADQIDAIKRALDTPANRNTHAFIASSLLIAHEGNKTVIKLIDFDGHQKMTVGDSPRKQAWIREFNHRFYQGLETLSEHLRTAANPGSTASASSSKGVNYFA